MKRLKKLLSATLIFTLLVSSASFSFASDTQAKLLNIYADGMLFKQNTDVNICGYGNPGSTITLSLKDKNNLELQNAETKVSDDGTFSISFLSPGGSFEEYSISIEENGKEFKLLKNIVFGELWLASGQSNMQYPLAQSSTGAEMFAESKKLSKWLRVLLVPAYPEYNNSTSLVPGTEQDDITDAVWVNGENPAIYSMSAVAYFFAEEIMKKLDMPVGILNSSLGGSSIRSWLSRETIDNNDKIKNYLTQRGEYISLDCWNESEQNIYFDMTANYNQKIAPLKNFRISGMIWYQGETDLMTGNTLYAEHLDLLQKSYSDLFNFSDGKLPIIFTQIASFNYSDDGLLLSNWNYDLTRIQASEKSSRALITIYNIPLTYLPEAGLIHPERKEKVGQRMAFSADGLIYNKNSAYTTATVTDVKIISDEVFISFDNTGDGLVAKNEKLKGFAICSDNGIYIKADAEIIDSDTIKVYSEFIEAPKSVTYAYCTANQTANLFASLNQEEALPVAPFITDCKYTDNLWIEKNWCDCDDELTWHTEDDSYSGFYNTWDSKNAEINFSENDSVDNTKGLNIKSDSKTFSVSPVTTYTDKLKVINFTDTETDYSSYGTLGFYIRNNGTEDITFSGLKLYKNSAVWYSPEISGTLDVETIIPADSQWHYISLNLNKLYHLGNECSLSYNNKKLEQIKMMEFSFSGSCNSKSDISIDNISFSPSNDENGTSYDVNIKNADNIIELLTAIVLTIAKKLSELFGL